MTSNRRNKHADMSTGGYSYPKKKTKKKDINRNSKGKRKNLAGLMGSVRSEE
jgi:hypothetical protein